MPHLAVLAFAVGDEEIGTRFFQQHIREVFRSHGRFLREHIVSAHDVSQH